MITLDEEALICDLAETYNIYDYRSLPCSKVATFSCGLRDNSRIKRKLSGINISQSDMLMASIVDSNNLLVWMQTKDGLNGKNKPESIVNKLLGVEDDKKQTDIAIFDSGEEFIKEWNRLTKGDT